MNRVQYAKVSIGTIALLALCCFLLSGCGRSVDEKEDYVHSKAPRNTRFHKPRPATVAAATPVILSLEDRHRNRVIEDRLRQDKIRAYSKEAPKWVADHILAYEYTRRGFGLEGAAAWGSGTYREEFFYWFGYADADGRLHMDLSIGLSDQQMNSLNGGGSEVRFTPGQAYTTGTGSHVYRSEAADWMEEFCTKPTRDECDIPSALEENLVVPANRLPGFAFRIGGRFPR